MTRRTQAERSAATQQLLADAAIGLLVERGWAATTAVAVCERAGVSRGALLHHFPSLSALLAHALESLYEDFIRRSRLPATSVRGIIDDVWRAAGDPRFKAVLEAWSAAANDAELAQEIAPAVGRFAALVSPKGDLPDSPVRDADARAFVLTAREALLGLALGRAYGGGRPLGHERIVLARLRSEADEIDARLDSAQQEERP